MTIILLFIISLVIFAGYLTFIVIKYGPQKSISDSYYSLPVRDRTLIFALFCWGFSFPIMVVGLEQTGNFLSFLAPAGIAFVGSAAAFNDSKLTYNVHMTSAVLGITASQVAVVVLYHHIFLFITFVVVSTTLVLITKFWKDIKYFWWIEIMAFSTYMLSILGRIIESYFHTLRF